MLATAPQMASFTVFCHSGQAPLHRQESTLVPSEVGRPAQGASVISMRISPDSIIF
jgi:hypothetical protein